MTTIEGIRNSITDDQRAILNKIWSDYQEHHEWPDAQFIHRFFGRNTKVRLILEKLGGSIVVESQRSGTDYYWLTLLGILLTDEGKFWQKCFVNYLRYISDMWDKNPTQTRVNNHEIADALELTPAQSMTFGELIRFSTRLSRDGSYVPNVSWEVELPKNVDEFPDDLEQYFEQVTLEDYDPNTPLSAEEKLGYRMAKKRQEEPRQSSQLPQEDFLPMEIVSGTRKYVEHVVVQMNGCYRNGWYDACAVMARRLLEILIIDSFEAEDKLSEIRETNYPALSFEVSEPPTPSEMRRFVDENFSQLETALHDVRVSLGAQVGGPRYAATPYWETLTKQYPDWPQDILDTFKQIAEVHHRGLYRNTAPALTKNDLLTAKRGIVKVLDFLREQFPSAGINSPIHGDIMSLKNLIKKYLDAPDTYWHVERGAKSAFGKIKANGDIGSHGRYRKVIKQSLKSIQDDFIAVVQQVIGTAYETGAKHDN